MFALRKTSPALCRMVATRTFASFPPPSSGSASLVAGDQTMAMNKVYHKSHYVSLALVPLAVAAHPSALSLPLDVALCVVLPVHAWIGMNWIFTDYVPGGPSGAPRVVLAVASVLATLGLLKIAVTGDGVVGTVKEMWTGAAEKKKSAGH